MPMRGPGEGRAVNKTYHLDPNEAYLIELVRSIKRENHGRGHGNVVVEIADGVETFARPSYSYQMPMKRAPVGQ